jgi:tripartite-type tricarboxylate transporter receptor subunit TctC
MNNICRVTAAFTALSLCTALAGAQGLTRPVRVLIGVPPGGPSDTVFRLISPKTSEALGQTLVVDNRPGSNGVAGTEMASKATPDGLTFSVGNSGTHAINASLYRKLPYDPVRDFIPITQMVTSGMVLTTNPKLQASSFNDLVTLAKKQPGRINIGIAGATGQLAGDALWSLTHIKMNNVHYKGSAPAEIALLSGEIDLVLLTPLASMQHINSGKLRALGITSAHRSPLLPKVATVSELGVPGYAYEIWHGIFAPAKTPDRFIRAMNKAAVAALNAPQIKDRLTSLGFVVIANTPEEFAMFVKREVEKYRKVIAESGIPLL